MNKSLLLLVAGGIIFCLSFNPLATLLDKRMLGPYPEVILAARDGAKTYPRILTRTGDIHSEEHKMNTLNSDQDSLELYIKLEGEKATATINARAVKQVSGRWKIYQSDTAFTE